MGVSPLVPPLTSSIFQREPSDATLTVSKPARARVSLTALWTVRKSRVGFLSSLLRSMIFALRAAMKLW